MLRVGGVLLLFAPVLLAEPAPPRVVLLFTKSPPSNYKKFEAAVERCVGKDNLDKEARKALRKSYRWSDKPTLMELPLGLKFELQVGRKPFDLKNVPKHRAWISLRALNRHSVESDHTRILRLLSDYVEGSKTCVAIYYPEYSWVHKFDPKSEKYEKHIRWCVERMRYEDPLVGLELKKAPPPPEPKNFDPWKLTEKQKKASKRAQERWWQFIAAWNAHEEFTPRFYWVEVINRDKSYFAATQLITIKNARNNRFYGEGANRKTVTVRAEDVVDWWYTDQDGKTVGKFLEQVALGK